MIREPSAIPEIDSVRTVRRPKRSASGEMMIPLSGRITNPIA